MGYKLLGDHGQATAHSCEACGFREGAEFNGAGLGSFNLVNGMGNARLGDIGLIGGIKKDD
jgi:hypothetical protein